MHGIDDDFLSTQPEFNQIAQEFLDFVTGAELVIHNAGFDIGFIVNIVDFWNEFGFEVGIGEQKKQGVFGRNFFSLIDPYLKN